MNQQRSGLVLAGLAALVAVTLVLVVMAFRHGTTVASGADPVPTPVAPSATTTQAPTGSTSSPSSAAATGTAIVGGGMTYADSSSGSQPGARSWLAYADQGDAKLFVRDQLTAAQAAKLVTGGPYAKLVIATADDDVAAGRSAEQSVGDMAALVTRTQTAPNAVVVLPLSPSTAVSPAQIRSYNRALRQAVTAKGWSYCDAWAPVRGKNGQWDQESDAVLGGTGASSGAARKVAAAVRQCLSAEKAGATSTG